MITNIRYKLSPQLKIYDEIQNDWKPYVMFKQPSYIDNNVIKTDSFGLRYTVEKKNQISYTLFDHKNSDCKYRFDLRIRHFGSFRRFN